MRRGDLFPDVASAGRLSTKAGRRRPAWVFPLEGVEVIEFDMVLKALRQYEETHLDWADCLLLVYSPDIPVYTFDQAMVAAGGVRPD